MSQNPQGPATMSGALGASQSNDADDDFLAPVGSTLQKLIPTSTLARNVIPTFATQAPRQAIPIYYLQSAVTDRQRKAVMTCMTLGGRCTEVRPTAWQSWVLTWSVLCFPELVKKFSDDTSAVDYTYVPFSEAFVNSCVEAIMAQGDEATAGDKFVTFPDGLPNTAVVAVNIELAEAGNTEALFAYYAMIIFIMGKSLSVENITSISTRRPDALMRKRQLHAYAYILTGEGRIHSDNYKHVQSGWIRSTRHRITIVQHLARLNAAPNRSEILDSIAVNMEMLRNANQSYLFYIHELLTACPWAVSIPALRNSYYHYIRMVNILAEQDEYIRPYYKLMMQDAAKDVRRRDIEPLIAVATFFAAQTRKTMNQYRINEGTFQTIVAFRNMAVAKGHTFEEIPNQLTTETAAV